MKNFRFRFWITTTHDSFLGLTKATVMISTDHICVEFFSLSVGRISHLLSNFSRKIENQL